MTSKNSYSSMTRRIREGCRRYIWVTILACIGFLLSIVLPVALLGSTCRRMLNWSSPDQYALMIQKTQLLGLVSFNNPASGAALVVLAIVGAMGVFFYLHGGKETDFFHSLPISRQKLFLVDYSIVPVIVIPCYIVINLLGVVTVTALGFGSLLSAPLILFGMVQSILFFLLVYSVAVLGVILCGNRIVSALFLLWLFFSPSVWVMVLDAYFGTLRTYISQQWVEMLAVKLSPIIYFFYRMDQADSLMFELGDFWNANQQSAAPLNPGGWAGQLIQSAVPALAGCLAAFLVISALCYLLFIRRKSEAAGSALAFERSKLPVKVYMTIMIALVGGLFLGAIAGYDGSDGFVWMIVGILIAGFIMHGVVEAIYRQDVRGMFKKLPHFAVCAVVTILIALFFKLDVMGYDTKRIDLSEIESGNFYCYSLGNHTNVVNADDFAGTEDIFQEEKSVEQLWNLANDCVDALEGQDEVDYDDRDAHLYCHVIFHTKSGGSMLRRYDVNSTSAKQLAMELVHTPEYVDYYHVLGQKSMEEMLESTSGVGNKLRLTAGPYVNTSEDHDSYIYDADTALKIWETAREEYLAADVEDLAAKLPECYIQMNYLGGAPIYSSYSKTLKLLRENSGYSRFYLNPAEVDYVRLSFTPWGDYYDYDRGGEAAVADMAQGAVTANVFDPDDIALLLRAAHSCYANNDSEYPRNDMESSVSMEVHMQNGERIYNMSWFEEDAPHALLERYHQLGTPEEEW